MREFHHLVEAVQRNCHIADARHARDMTLCTYLLEMREYFRWENDIPLTDQPPREEVGRWLSERELLWADLEEADYGELPVEGRRYAPFDVAPINDALTPEALVYGAGIGRFGRPHFFLGRLDARERREGLEILRVGCEYARDITGIPAALQGETIILRSEALRRWLWEKFELWGLKRRDGALAAALDHYGLTRDPSPAIELMAAAESETLILHEIGEARAGRLLGPEWEMMISSLTDRRAELLARAVRDLLADCLVTLPALIERKAEGSLHFYFANFEGLRREFFPALAESYRRWSESGEAEALADTVARGAEHWLAMARRVLSRAAESQASVCALVEDRTLRLAG